MKRSSILLILSIAVLTVLITAVSAFAATDGTAGYTLGKNGDKAKDLFSIYDNDIIFADSMDTMRRALSAAEDRANGYYDEDPADDYVDPTGAEVPAGTVPDDQAQPSSRMYMVYMVPGDYKVETPVVVPENVLLVGEKDTTYTFTYKGSKTYAFLLHGSVYGGSFIWKTELGDKKGRMLLFDDHAYTAPNGIAQNTYVSKAGWSGIEARGTSSKGCQVIGNTITDCEGNGVRSIGGSTIALIEGNKISGSGQAGIDITKANVTTIRDNVIKNVKGHGISTDTEQVFSKGQLGYGCKNKCVIKNVIDNTITGTGTHGIYLEDNCHIKGTMSGNKIGKCGKCALGAHPKTTVGKVINNELYTAKLSVFSLAGKAVMGDGNVIRSGKAQGITLQKGGKLTIKGKNNKIYKNKSNGIQLVESCSLTITGKKTTIYSNKWGVNLGKKCKATIKNAKIYSNKYGAILGKKGSSFTTKNCSIKGNVYRQK